jgi:uroporphyrinogen decarboxylase
VFDSWGGVLADGAFQEFSLAYTARVLAGLKRTGADGQPVPRIVFTKGGGLWLDAMRELDCEVLGVDWTVNLASARKQIAEGSDGKAKALQGNIDPNVLFAEPAQIRAEVTRTLESFGPHPGHVFNLGHGISQHTPPEHVAVLVDTVHEVSRRLRAAK